MMPLAETAPPATTSNPNSPVPPLAPVAVTSPPRATDTSSTPGWVVLGAGAVVLIGALVMGVLANAADDEFTAKCGGIKESTQA